MHKHSRTDSASLLFTMCVKPVHGLRKAGKVAHNLCASQPGFHAGSRENHSFVRSLCQLQSLAFPHPFSAKISLLHAPLSTFYTVPINTITTYIIK